MRINVLEKYSNRFKILRNVALVLAMGACNC